MTNGRHWSGRRQIMVTFVAVALGILMLGGASYRLRAVARGWNDRARAENLSMAAWMVLAAFYGACCLFVAGTRVFDSEMTGVSATVLLVAMVATAVVCVLLAVASLLTRRRAWSADNKRRAEFGLPRRRHWMPPGFVFVLWYIGGALVAVSGALLIISMGAIDPALADNSDRLGTLVFALTCGAFLIAVVVAGIQWWSLRTEDARMQLADHQMLTAGSGGPAGQ
ncbi:hypothetical protein [Rhodococcus opacus]|uniref:hypothetical protein n=1 Tax=Rhodococcus opacus TaxID=37919 RepID=UPI0024767E00|nr:hypothetical protein [Rhodococcus opacus]MDH6293146.1 heme/copper-type cytochrome/quinol oxidase subunit 4 [Rhodococcus opacus]